MIQQDERRNYSLTNIGEIVTRQFEQTNLAVTALSQNREFWLNHDLSDIPKHILDKIAKLVDSTVVTSSPTDILKVFTMFYMLLENSKEIHGISPIFDEQMTTFFIKLMDKEINIELIFTPDVLDATLRTADRQTLQKGLKTNLRLFKMESQVNFALTVTDYYMLLGFFRPDGSFDWSSGLLSYSADAIEWGRELFAYYFEKTEPVIL